MTTATPTSAGPATDDASATDDVSAADNVRWFSELGLADLEQVGGKNSSLGEMVANLTSAGVRVPDGFAKREVELGRADDDAVEVVSGLSPGEEVVVGNSFLLKAELGKSEADHDH